MSKKLLSKAAPTPVVQEASHEAPRGLDRFDLKILDELQRDARLTNAELAQRVGLSAAPCWRRVRRLETEGFIEGYHASINRHKIGLGVVAFVRLFAERNTGAVTEEIKRQILALPQVLSCHHISGEGSFEIVVVHTDLEGYAKFVRDVLINLPHIKDLRTSFSLGEVKNLRQLPLDHLR
jgi:Lrp/AsnC family transcriptional regulator, leucine-responsive regulatory protein